MFTRRQFLCASGALLGLALLSGCRHTVQIGSPTLIFRQGDMSCGTGDGESEIVGAVGMIRFSGAMTTPDPCHRLEAMLEHANDLLIVHITARSSLKPNEFCIKCLGRATYSGEITGLRAGRYRVRILHGERQIVEREISVL